MARIHRRAPGTYEVVLESGHDPKSGKRQRQTFTVRGTTRDAERGNGSLLAPPEAKTAGRILEPGSSPISRCKSVKLSSTSLVS